METNEKKHSGTQIHEQNGRKTCRREKREWTQGLPLKEYLYTPLDPGEKFSYVYVKTDQKYDTRGCKINIQSGDMMEYVHVAKKYEMEMDVIFLSDALCSRYVR